jgi:LPXTG-motif cell wall-anchored protein
MTRPHLRRSAGAALTLGTAAATLLLGAPAASAADLPAPTISATTIAPGQSVTISGTGCVEPGTGTAVLPAGIIIAGDSGLELGDGGRAQEGGSWTITTSIGAGSTLGAHQILVTCDRYDGEAAYPPIAITVGTATTTATPAPAPKPLATGDRTTYNKVTAGTPFTLGERFSASYPGFKPYEVVTLVLHSTPQNVGTFTANASGVVTVSFTIPAGTVGGSHELTMSGNLGTSFAQALKVAPSRSLAYTGTDVTTPLAVGGSLLLVGGALLVAARRRSAGAPQA